MSELTLRQRVEGFRRYTFNYPEELGLREALRGTILAYETALGGMDTSSGFTPGGFPIDPRIMEARAALASPPPGNGWVSVKDRLPDEGAEVLTFSRENGHNFYDLAYRDGERWGQSWTPKMLEHVTHWMPLPAPPACPRCGALHAGECKGGKP